MVFKEYGAFIFKALGEIAFTKEYPLEDWLDIIKDNLNWFHTSIKEAKDKFDLKSFANIRMCLHNYNRIYITYQCEPAVSELYHELGKFLIENFNEVSQHCGDDHENAQGLREWKSESF
jgi:hypothetical protein